MKTAKNKGRARRKPAYYRIRAIVGRALGNENRLMILDSLAEGETCVCDIVRVLGCDQSTVSKHLSLLKNAGLVEERRAGTRVYYRLACPCIPKFFDCIEEVVSSRLSRQQKMLDAARKGSR